MEHHPASAWLAGAVNAAEGQGPGMLRIVLIVMILGCALTAWFLLRGYRRKDDCGHTKVPRRAPGPAPAAARVTARGTNKRSRGDRGTGPRLR